MLRVCCVCSCDCQGVYDAVMMDMVPGLQAALGDSVNPGEGKGHWCTMPLVDPFTFFTAHKLCSPVASLSSTCWAS
jgi:hypothetical protein